ncbi:TspO/MBR family protein [Microbacterium immunditiarum]|uniref:Tryptophan-rich sensory protein n=1 Tax=Microbacterium immunditiarum TaxID=337480 RepID=A0A7Y9GS73_9MICO|nr:TspO/MBR family protein [Microbacterium immunditiarum]NYE21416.1 hypothetical protein [Microbacterium immunditiarum]
MSTRESVLTDRRTPGTAGDVLRQVAVISAFCFMLIASLTGSGVFGGPSVDELQDGALSAEGSYLAPAGPAFSIWSVIYVGLAAYTIWQALPSQRANPRQRSLGWLIAGSMVLNGLWLVIARFGSLVGTVLAIVGLLIVLAIWFQRAVVTRSDGWLDALLIDGVSGLHFGWVTVATVANTAAWLTAIAPPEWELAADVWGIVMLVLVGIIALGIAGAGGWRIAPALAIAWGLSWIAVGRLAGEPHSAPIGITAVIVAAVVLIVSLAGAAITRAADVRNAGA